MANDKAALDAILKTYGDAFAAEEASLTQLLAKVTALIDLVKANPGGDFTNEITALQSLVASTTDDKAKMDAAIAAAGSAGA